MEENTQVSDQSQTVAGGVVENTTELKANDTVAYDTFRKVLSEKKKAAEEVASWRARAQQLEQEKLEKEGNLSQLVETLREQNRGLSEEVSSVKRQRAYEIVSNQIRGVAKDLGCLDEEALLKLGDFRSLEPDETGAKANDQDVRLAVETVMKTRPYLFRKAVAPVKDMPPSSKSFSTAEKPLNKLSDDEIMEKLREIEAIEKGRR